MCNGEVHKVRGDGTKIQCDNGSFKAIKGRKGKAEAETKDSKNDSVKIMIMIGVSHT